MKRAPPWFRAARHRLADLALGGALLPVPLLPLGSRGLAGLLGMLMRAGAGNMDRQVRQNLRLALGPVMTPGELEQVRRRHFVHLAQSVLELLEALHCGWERFERGLEVRDLHWAERALEKGRGLVVYSAHYGNWELCLGCMAHRGYSVATVTRAMANVHINERIRRFRVSQGVKDIDRSSQPRAFLGALRDNVAVAIMGDFDARVHSQVEEFFGFPVNTPTAAVSLARTARCPLVPTIARRLPDGRHELRFFEPLPVDRSTKGPGPIGLVLKRYNAILEQAVRECPEQWIWGQKRWLVRGPGESRIHFDRRMKRAVESNKCTQSTTPGETSLPASAGPGG